jgi:predicted CXXCH cytochrome family protein
MRRLLVGIAVVAVAVGRTRAADFNDPGICARCHDTQVAAVESTGGHAATLDCAVCHEDARPGVFGRGHRSIPTSCTTHHATPAATHPAPRRSLPPKKIERRCLACHDVHGSSNAHLVRTSIKARGRLRRVDFQDAGGAVAGGFVDPSHPGRGLCEICHQTTRVYRADGKGQPHFTSDCTLCHDHTASFEPVITDASCPSCHAAETGRLARASGHHDEFSGRCSSCHVEVDPAPGPGHRAIAACEDCHNPAVVATHVPPGNRLACTSCHDPHGSDNIRLIRDVIHTVQGTDRPMHFANVEGRVDGSFASASSPGTGLCEVCHTTTQFYRADGTGAPHYVIPCEQCHRHAIGWTPG